MSSSKRCQRFVKQLRNLRIDIYGILTKCEGYMTSEDIKAFEHVVYSLKEYSRRAKIGVMPPRDTLHRRNQQKLQRKREVGLATRRMVTESAVLSAVIPFENRPKTQEILVIKKAVIDAGLKKLADGEGVQPPTAVQKSNI